MGRVINEHKSIILVLFIIGIIFRLLVLSAPNDMWHDASFTYEFSEKPILDIIDSNDVHPPLFYFGAKIWQSISTNEIWLRMFSMVGYCAFFYIFYKYLTKHHSELVTVITLAFVSSSSTMILYSVEYRNYMWGMVFVLAQVYYFRKYIGTKNTDDGLLFILFSLAMLYTHYFTVFVLLVEVIYLLVKRRSEFTTIFVEKFIIIGIYSIPLCIYFMRTLPKIHSMWFKDITLLSFLSTLTYQLFPSETVTEFHLVVLFVFVLFWAFSFYIRKQNNFFYHIMFFVPVVLVWLISQIHSLYHHRFFLFYSFALYIIIAQVIETYLSNKKFHIVGTVLFGSMIVIMIMSFAKLPETLPTELHDSSDFLKDYLDEDDKYIFIHDTPFSFTPYNYYFRDWNIVNVLNTKLTKKERFTAGGSVIHDLLVIEDVLTLYCFDGCYYITDKPIYSGEKIYDEGGLRIYEMEKRH